jgi:hypothetical protein
MNEYLKQLDKNLEGKITSIPNLNFTLNYRKVLSITAFSKAV